MKLLFLALLASLPAHAGNVLSIGSSYPVKKELTAPAPALQVLDSFYTEMQMDYESFDANNPAAPAKMSTHTEQLTKVKKLPKPGPADPAYSKDGFNERLEFTFEKLVNSTHVQVPGLKNGFETRSDLSTVLSNKPFLVRSDEKGGKRIENLADVKKAALAQTPDTSGRTTVNMLLTDDLMLKVTAVADQKRGCVEALAGKKPGDKWNYKSQEQGASLDYECNFEGWAESLGKKVLVVNFHSAKQTSPVKLPSGAAGTAETEGSGTLFLEPLAPESLVQSRTSVQIAPSRSVMQLRTHLFPL